MQNTGMGLEAVPCVLRSAANDGNNPYCTIGFLIRPSSSTNSNAVQPVSNAVAISNATSVTVSGGNVPKSIQVVPAAIQKQHTPIAATATPKLVVPSVLRIQPAPCTSTNLAPHSQPTLHSAPLPPPPPVPAQHHHSQHQQQQQQQQQQQHCATDNWLHAAPRSNISSGSFESPSPSQVVPQMTVSESYDCQMPCTSTTTFFPPISSITQSFSSGKSDIDLLQELTHHVDLNSSMHQQQQLHHENKTTVRISHCEYTQPHHNITPPPPPSQHNHRYQSNASTMHNQNPSATCAPMQNSYQTHMQVDMNGRMSVCRYQNNYGAISDCSVTPDSGIQSIADSPPADPFTPPVPSPTPYIAPPPPPIVRSVKEKEQQPVTMNSCDDFSDMPRLIPFHQMESEGDSPIVEEEPPLCMTEITPVESVTETVKSITSTSVKGEKNPDQHSETTLLIQGKEDKKLDDNIPKIAITPAMNVSDLVEQLMSHMDPEQRKQFASAIQSKVAIEDGPATNATPETLSVATSAVTSNIISTTTTTLTTTSTTTTTTTVTNICDENIATSTEISVKEFENEVAVQTEFSNVLEAQSQDIDSEISGHKNLAVEKKRKSKKRKIREESRLTNENSSKKARKGNSDVRSDDIITQCSLDNKISDEKEREKTNICLLSSSKIEKMKPHKEEPKNLQKNPEVQKKCVVEPNYHAGKLEKKEAQVEPVMRPGYMDEQVVYQIREYHLDMKRRLNEQLKLVIEQVEKQFSKMELNLGERMHWDLPWYRLDWKEFSRRLAEKKHNEKSTSDSNASKIRRTGSHRKLHKAALPKNIDSFDASAVPSSSRACDSKRRPSNDYIKIKQNIIIDAYPKIEQMQCSCSSGCCGESDECLNRVLLMECSNTCPRNIHCTNKRMTRRECIERLRTFDTMNGCGIGVKSDVNIDKGQFICEYVGEVVSMETFNTRTRTCYRYLQNHYALNLCPGFVVDAYRKGNIARFVNHSCAPNCEMQRWSVNGQYRIGLFALRKIREGEELTYDYNWDAFEFDDVTVCCCGAPNCRKFLNKNVIMNNREREIARDARLLLLRNVRVSAAYKLQKFKREFRSRSRNRMLKKSYQASSSMQLAQLCQEVLTKFSNSKVASRKQLKKLSNFIDEFREQNTVVRTLPEVMEAIEMKISSLLDKSKKLLDRKKLEIWHASFASIKTKYLRQTKKTGKIDLHSARKSKTGPHRTLTAAIDYRYLDSNIPVGSYDHDSLLHINAASANTDCVRCICGTTDDDGPMIQCEQCNFWLHEECVFDNKPAEEIRDFICTICAENAHRTPVISIPLRVQPDYNFKNCTYYRTLVNSRHLQVRLGETVYVQKLENDNHKLILRRLVECTKQGSVPVTVDCVKQDNEEIKRDFTPLSFHRRSVRCLRIERLFSFEGHKFVFGFYYARPHEVYCEPGKLFHEKELFSTSMYDTLPLDSVVGRCLALEPSIYCLGRPKMPRYEEVDVYFVEYQTGKNYKFEKIPVKHHYNINTDAHIFSRFETELTISRAFTPFIVENGNKNVLDLDSSRNTEFGNSKSRKRKKANLETIIGRLPIASGRIINVAINSSSEKPQNRKRPRAVRY